MEPEPKRFKILKPKLIFISSDAPINSEWSDFTALNYALDSGKKDLANIILLKGNCRVNDDLNTPSNTPLHKAVKLGDIELYEKLLAKNASVIAVDPEGNTPLHLAFILKRKNIVKSLLEFHQKHKIYNNLKNKEGLTYLHIACTQKNQEIIQGFLNNKANVQDSVRLESPYYPGFTAMHFVIKFKVEEAAEALIQADKKSPSEKLNDSLIVNYIFHQQHNKNKEGFYKEMTNFHLACMKDNPEVLERYIKFGADINIPISSEVNLCPLYVSLHFAVEANCIKNVKLLLEYGARFDNCNSLKMTPVHLAFYYQNHHQDIFNFLWAALKEDSIDNKKDYYGLSYLHMAVAKNEFGMVMKFCDSGEDLNGRVRRNNKNFSGYAPLHFAVKFQHLEMAEFLINRGVEVTTSRRNSTTVMHLAVEAGNKNLVDLLLRNGAEVDDTVRNEDEQTVLHALVNKNSLEMLEYAEKFVGLGCDVDGQDSEGNTALHVACAKISHGTSYIKVLLNLGADINLKNDKGWTPMMEARDRKCSNFTDVLWCHIKKLKAIGAKIDSSNQQSYEIAIKHAINASKFIQVDKQIKDELERMRKIKLLGYMPLSDFLILKPCLAATYVVDDLLKFIVEDERMIDRYPIYGYLIKLQFRKGNEYCKQRKRSVSVEILEDVTRSTSRRRE